MFWETFLELCNKNNTNPTAVVSTLHIAGGSVTKWKEGSTPRGTTLQKIADHFGVSVNYLLGKETTPQSPDYAAYPGIFAPKMQKIPLLGKTACGEPIYSPNFDDGYALLDENYVADFALQAQGDSMKNAAIHDGDIVYFVAQDMVDNGQIAAVVIGEEVTLKRVYYYREKNKLVLQPENPDYEPLVYTGEELNAIRIIGRAVAHLRKL